MNFVTLHTLAGPVALSTLDAYPAVASVKAELIEERPNSRGGHSLEAGMPVELPADARIISDQYEPAKNKLILRILTNSGAVVRTYRARLNVDKRVASGIKTLHAKLMRIPPASTHGGAGIVQDSFGRTFKLPRRLLTQQIIEELNNWIYNVYTNAEIPLQGGIPSKVDWSLIPKSVQDNLGFEELKKCDWIAHGVKAGRAGGRLAYQLVHASNQIDLKTAVESGLLPDYPTLDLPGRVLHTWDTHIGFKFAGVIQKGGAANYTKNTQTANRISALSGETVTPEQLLSLREENTLNEIYLGHGISCYPFVVITKETKGARK